MDVAFIAAHLLTPALNSGGDVLFANIAREAARLRPDWRIAAVAPDFACAGLAPFFRTVVPLPSAPADLRRTGLAPHQVALMWARRIGQSTRAAAALQPLLVHATGDFFVDVLSAARVSRLSAALFTGVVHHLNAPPLLRRAPLVTATGSWLLQQMSLSVLRRRCDRVLLLGSDVESALRRRGFPATKLAVVGAGIDLARFGLLPPPASRDRILWVHRLEPTKGIFDLPRLAQRLPERVTIDVVGRGPHVWRERLVRELETSGVGSRVRLHGYLDEPALAALYREANLFISCSYEEGWGISLAEALASGLPCLAYALPSHAAVFGDAVETVPAGDVAAFARHALEMLARPDDPAVRARRRAAVEPHSFTAVAARQVAIFDALLAARPMP